MKVSVIVPIYNRENYLARCLDSIRNQTEADLEIILVDDGSTDGSGKICDAYAKTDPRFQVLHQKNGGVSSARNAGLGVMTGRYCCFVDSDDFIDRQYISVLVHNANAYHCDLSVCGLTRTNTARHSGKVTLLNRPEAQESLFQEAGGMKGYIGGKLFHAELIKKHKISFDETQTLAEDLLFLFDYLSCCQRENTVCILDHPLYYYENGSMGALAQRGRTDVFLESWCDAVRACEKILQKIPEEERRLRRAVELEQTMQCVTMLRIMANYGEQASSKAYQKFLRTHLIPYLFSHRSLQKKLGAIAVLVCPQKFFERKRANG